MQVRINAFPAWYYPWLEWTFSDLPKEEAERLEFDKAVQLTRTDCWKLNQTLEQQCIHLHRCFWLQLLHFAVHLSHSRIHDFADSKVHKKWKIKQIRTKLPSYANRRAFNAHLGPNDLEQQPSLECDFYDYWILVFTNIFLHLSIYGKVQFILSFSMKSATVTLF